MKDKKHDDELREIAPGLSGLKQEDGFSVPHNYFKELPDRVFSKIEAGKASPATSGSWFHGILRPKLVLAFTSVAILIIAGIWYCTMQSQKNPMATISEDEALEYVLNNLSEFTSEDLISAGLFGEWDAGDIIPVQEDELDAILEDDMLIEELMN